MLDSAKSIIISALNEKFPDVRFSSRIPEDKPDYFVTVDRIGGGRGSFATRDPRFLIEVYSLDEDTAEIIAENIELQLPKLKQVNKNIVSVKPDRNLVEYSDADTEYTKFQLTCTAKIRLVDSDVNNDSILGE